MAPADNVDNHPMEKILTALQLHATVVEEAFCVHCAAL